MYSTLEHAGKTEESDFLTAIPEEISSGHRNPLLKSHWLEVDMGLTPIPGAKLGRKNGGR
jgi:hypothetical protein